MVYNNCDEELITESALMLNGLPLVRCRSSECPTCGGMLAAGYGRGEISSEEIRAVSDGINKGYESLEKSIETISPLLGLLETGLYMISDRQVFPTDGDGRFFWDVPPEMTVYSAFCDQYYGDGWLAVADLEGRFIYPTQSPDRYDESRVDVYEEMFRQGIHPRAIALCELGNMSALLDGHHKACAAARLHEPLDTIVISPCYAWYDHRTDRKILWFGDYEKEQKIVFCDDISLPDDVKDKYTELFGRIKARKISLEKTGTAPCMTDSRYRTRKWEKVYTSSVRYYPNASRYADICLSGADRICEDTAEEILRSIDGIEDADEREITACAVLCYLEMKRDCKLRDVASSLARQKICPYTKRIVISAMRALSDMHDEETEKLFVDLALSDDMDIVGAALDHWDDI
ncbi:MAG: hypothetical protein IKR73_08055 [Oscillospiraceae bacterium]|nr:hypothetical protein [Oscillospiraceae bacterium]